MDFRILYVVNFFGTPPLNYLSKYLAEQTNCKLTVIKLPSVSLSQNGIEYEAFIMDETGQKKSFRVALPVKVSPALAFAIQYILNTYAAFKLVRGRGKFDIGIGETSFGSFVMYLYKRLGRVKKTVFMNGDVLPIFGRKVLPYYLHSEKPLIKFIDKIFVHIQLVLRKIGVRNDIVWYANQKIREWDLENKLYAKSYFIAPAVTIDKNETKRNLTAVKIPNTIGYLGRLDANAGVDMSLQALAILSKKLPTVKIVYVGGSKTAVQKYLELAKGLGVEANVDFRGFVEKTEDAIDIISQTKFGLAVYKPDEENVSLYADISKPKEYLRAGLPVIMTTNGPSLGLELQKLGAGVLTEFDPTAVANTCLELLTNESKYNQIVSCIESAAERYDYRKNCKEVLESIQSFT